MRSQAVFRLVALHVEDLDARQDGIFHRPFAQFQLAVAPRLRMVPAFQRGRGRTEHDGNLQLPGAPHGQVARRIAQAFLLLVGRVVFLVDDDQFQFRQGRQDGQPGAEHDARLALVGGQPVQHALAFGQAAVQGGQHDAGKARADIAFQLGRQIDFRHQDQDLRIVLARQHLSAGLQIHFRLAAARHAVQQGRLEALRAADGIGRFLLGGIQCRHVQRRAIVRIGQLGQLLDGAVQCHGGQHAQILRQTRQRHLAQRTLVVIGGEGGQRQPLLRQRRQLAAHGQHVLQFRGGHVGTA